MPFLAHQLMSALQSRAILGITLRGTDRQTDTRPLFDAYPHGRGQRKSVDSSPTGPGVFDQCSIVTVALECTVFDMEQTDGRTDGRTDRNID